MKINKIHQGDALDLCKKLKKGSIDCVMTSPPYWALRDYGVKGQLGLETTFEEYIDKLCNIFDDILQALKKKGTCWVNLGDTYSGSNAGSRWNTGHNLPLSGGKKKLFKLSENSKSHKIKHSIPRKSQCLIPHRFAIEMINRGWILRNTIVWHKPNIMPSSIKDRFTGDFEYLFFFVKSKSYYFEQQFEPQSQDSINRMKYQFGGVPGAAYPDEDRESPYPKEWKPNPKGRNKRSVWRIKTNAFPKAHFAVFPQELCEIPIKAGCPEKGIVLDPFIGSGTTAVVARKLNRNFIGFDLNPEYIELAEKEIQPHLEQQNLKEMIK